MECLGPPSRPKHSPALSCPLERICSLWEKAGRQVWAGLLFYRQKNGLGEGA